MTNQRRALLGLGLGSIAALMSPHGTLADEYGAIAVIPFPTGSEWTSPMTFDFWVSGLGQYYTTSARYSESPVNQKLRLINDKLRVNFPDLFTSALLEVDGDFYNVRDLNSGPLFLSTEDSKILTNQPGRYTYDHFGGYGIRGSDSEYQLHLDWLALSEDFATYGEGSVYFNGRGLNALGGTMTLRTNIHEEGLSGNVKPIRGSAEITGGFKYSVSAGPRSYTAGLTIANDWGQKATVIFTFDTESQLRMVSVIGEVSTWVHFPEQPGGAIFPAERLDNIPVTVRIDVPNEGPLMMNVSATLPGSGISVSGGNTAQGGEVIVTIDANTLVDWIQKSAGI